MRQASIGDSWRHLRSEKAGRSRLEEVILEAVPPFEECHLSLRTPVRLFVGSNGAGKTSLLRLLSVVAGAAPLGFTAFPVPSHMSAGRVVTSLTVAGETRVHEAELPLSDRFSREYVYHLDSVEAHSEQARVLAPIQEMSYLLDPLGPLDLDPNDVGFLVGRDYESVTAYELTETELADALEGVRSEIGVLPYFEVRTQDGLSYDSRSMGLGEWSAAYLYWSIVRSERGSMFFIEEPESFLSPRSQGRFSDLLATMVDATDSGFVITTHSTMVARPWPSAYSTVLTQLGATSHLHGAAGIGFLESFLGTDVVRGSSFIGVEDELARLVLRELLSLTSARCAWSAEVLPLNGASVLRGWIDNQPRGSTCVAVFDGDMRGDVHGGRVQFLPGTQPPEELIREWVRQNVSALADALSRPLDDVRAVLSGAEGQDSHDWLTDVALRLGFVHSHLLASRLVRELFARDAQFRASAMELSRTLDRLTLSS